MTRRTPLEAARKAAESVRELNHQTMPRAAQIDVVDVYDLLAELGLLASRLPQLLRQLEDLVDALVEADQVLIVDGPNAGDPVAAAVIAGHWLAAAAGAADELAHRVDAAQQTLTWAASAHPDPFLPAAPSSPSRPPSSSSSSLTPSRSSP